MRAWLLLLLAAIPYYAGWLVGYAVRGIIWITAALVAGYKAGRGGSE